MSNQTRPVAGGQALLDGVMMRTDRAWAVARADGSIRVGEVAPVPGGGLPLLRVYTSLVPALVQGLGAMVGRDRTSAPGSRSKPSGQVLRMLVGVVAAQAIATGALFQLQRRVGNDKARRWRGPVTILTSLGVLRLVLPGQLWRYHGAEHKAVSAYEAGFDPADVDAALAATRLHPRCGTNAVVLLTAAELIPGPTQPVAAIAWALVTKAGVFELLRWAARRPSSTVAKAIALGGMGVQKVATTAEPSRAEQAVGCAALAACLDEHARVTSGAPIRT